MRLINTRTLELEEFVESPPPYAILSHTWGSQEISFQQMQRRKTDAQFPSDSEGWRKIQKFCGLALDDGFLLGWVDTCCIDKSSSAELQESINSMFLWYREAAVCYAYLRDTQVSDPSRAPIGSLIGDDDSFAKSRWFRRGWTLQELIAPKELIFIQRDWSRLGPRSQLEGDIHRITGIPKVILRSSESGLQDDDLKRFTVAEKMSWAAGRETTRVEDRAYCLLGLFGVNIPLIYGERERAFHRLQLEIIKTTNDSSILAWGLGDPVPGVPDIPRPVLARSPEQFRHCQILAWCDPDDKEATEPTMFSQVQLGLQLQLPVARLSLSSFGPMHAYYGFLTCGPRRAGRDFWNGRDVVAIPLVRRSDSNVFLQGSWCCPTIVPRELVRDATRMHCYLLESDVIPGSRTHFTLEITPKSLSPLLPVSPVLKFAHPPYPPAGKRILVRLDSRRSPADLSQITAETTGFLEHPSAEVLGREELVGVFNLDLDGLDIWMRIAVVAPSERLRIVIDRHDLDVWGTYAELVAKVMHGGVRGIPVPFSVLEDDDYMEASWPPSSPVKVRLLVGKHWIIDVALWRSVWAS